VRLYFVVPPEAGYWFAGEPLLPLTGPLFIAPPDPFCGLPMVLGVVIGDEGLPAALPLLGPPAPPAPPVACAIAAAVPPIAKHAPSAAMLKIFLILELAVLGMTCGNGCPISKFLFLLDFFTG
jgi:hypothetical protein